MDSGVAIKDKVPWWLLRKGLYTWGALGVAFWALKGIQIILYQIHEYGYISTSTAETLTPLFAQFTLVVFAVVVLGAMYFTWREYSVMNTERTRE